MKSQVAILVPVACVLLGAATQDTVEEARIRAENRLWYQKNASNVPPGDRRAHERLADRCKARRYLQEEKYGPDIEKRVRKIMESLKANRVPELDWSCYPGETSIPRERAEGPPSANSFCCGPGRAWTVSTRRSCGSSCTATSLRPSRTRRECTSGPERRLRPTISSGTASPRARSRPCLRRTGAAFPSSLVRSSSGPSRASPGFPGVSRRRGKR